MAVRRWRCWDSESMRSRVQYYIPIFGVPILWCISGCSNAPDLGRAEQYPFAPNQAVKGCAGYFEARCDNKRDSVNVWNTHLYAKAFFTEGKNEEWGNAWTNVTQEVRVGLDTLPYHRDTLSYREGTVSYRNWFSNGKLKRWDHPQIWNVEDKDLGAFCDTLSSPAQFAISYPNQLLKIDSALKRNGFTVSYTNPHCDSVWIRLLTGVFPQKGQPFEIYVNDMSIRSFFNKKVPATGMFTVLPSMLDSMPPNSMIGVTIVAQTAKFSKHFGKWYIFRSTSVASIDRP
jgi:hypothetical protein